MSADALSAWSTAWRDQLPPDDPERAARLISEASEAIGLIQQAAQNPPRRAFHAASPYGTTTAVLRIDPGLPEALRGGFLQPGARYRAIVRYSSAASRMGSQGNPDQRGLAARVVGPEGEVQDLLFTSGSEEHHARDARAMIVTLRAAAAGFGPFGKLGSVVALIRGLGFTDGLRIVRTVGALADSRRSLARMPFFSRAPFQLGAYAVKHRLTPEEGGSEALPGEGPTALTQDLVARRRQGPVRYRWEAHGFVSPEATSLEDHRATWNSPWLTLGELELPAQAEASEALATEVAAALESLSFSPHVRWDDDTLRPLGELNMLRAAYLASARGSARAPLRQTPLHPGEVWD